MPFTDSLRWNVLPGGLAPKQSLDELKHALCAQRGIPLDSDSFFRPNYEQDIHDPFLLDGMEVAVDRTYKALQRGESIIVYGDYDIDGISATAIVVTALQTIGARVSPYLPHRIEEGYGLNRAALESLEPALDLLITVDCGVNNHEEIAWLRSKGKDVIVIDHHNLPQTAVQAYSILHPRIGLYPWPHLCAAGVAWKFAQALLRDDRFRKHADFAEEASLLDLALLGTLGDMVPLLGENRLIVQFGLKTFAASSRIGLRVLAEVARIDLSTVTCEDLSFRIIPLLNAAGRIDHPHRALDLLLADHEKAAGESAQTLVRLNATRRLLTKNVVKEAHDSIDPDAPVLVASNLSWPAGIVGLAAAHLSRTYQKPAVVIGGNGVHGVGSARASGAGNVLEGLESARQFTMRLGGHAGAAGFSIQEEHIPSFTRAITEFFRSAPAKKFERICDAVLDEELISWETVHALSDFEPFGSSNERPVFIIRNLSVSDVRTVGKSGEHLKITFRGRRRSYEGIGFGIAGRFSPADRVDIQSRLDVNVWNGEPRIQLRIEEIMDSEKVEVVESQTSRAFTR